KKRSAEIYLSMLQNSSLQRVVLFLLLAFLVTAALYYAKPFLVPVCFGGLLGMLFLPLSLWFERKGIPKALSILFCILIFLATIAGIIWLISWQISDLATESTDIENKVKKMIAEVQDYVRTNFGISRKKQEEIIAVQAGSNNSFIS